MKSIRGRGEFLLDAEGHFERGQEVQISYTQLSADRVQAVLTDLVIDGQSFPGTWELYVHGFLVAISSREPHVPVRWMLSTWTPSCSLPDPYQGRKFAPLSLRA